MSESVGGHHVNNLDGESGWELYRCAVDRAHLEQAVTLFGQADRRDGCPGGLAQAPAGTPGEP